MMAVLTDCPKEAIARLPYTYRTRTAGACSISSEVDNKDRLMNPAGPLAGSVESAIKDVCTVKRPYFDTLFS
jgi:hypothetical protein